MARRWILLAPIVVAVASEIALAQSATQVVQFQVTAVNQIAVSGDPSPLVIVTATAGSAPTSVVGTGTSYAITTNESNKKITASLDQPMPTGITLEVALAAPTGAVTSGSVVLGTAGADVVTGITAMAASSLPITYRLSATPAVHMPTPASRTVTFTIVSGS
jgi:hypothetical protein